MVWTLRKESQVPSIRRATRGLRAMNALCTQLCMNTRTAIDAAIGLESHLHLLCQVGIFSAMLSGKASGPSSVNSLRNFWMGVSEMCL